MKRWALPAVLVTAAVTTVFVLRRKAPEPSVTRVAPPPLVDPEPHLPACAFWRPWQTLVAPDAPPPYLTRMKTLIGRRAQRTDAFRAAVARARGVLAGESERLCIVGRFAGDDYVLDAAAPEQCDLSPSGFLELNLRIDVERRDTGGYVNAIALNVGTGAMTPKSLLAFDDGQLAVLRQGYRGWSKAFASYAQQSQAGLALTTAADDAGTIKVALTWANQPMLGRLPRWADYLLRLGDLTTDEMRIVDGEGRTLLATRLDTATSQASLELAAAPARQPQGLAARAGELQPHAFLLAGGPALWDPHLTGERPLTVRQDVTVRFRGLVIELRGFRHTGTYRFDGDRLLEYAGSFAGVDAVRLGGAYRGMGLKMIHELVEDALKKEIDRLRDWTFRLALQDHTFAYETRFSSPVNFANLLREDKDETGNPVLPDKSALADLNRWSAEGVDALLADYARAACPTPL